MLANPNRNVARDWEAVKLPDLLGKEYVFVSVHEAMRYALVSHACLIGSVMKRLSGVTCRARVPLVFPFPLGTEGWADRVSLHYYHDY